MECLKCNGNLPLHEGPGRPRKYCSDACLKAATKEIRRLDARIASLEMMESQTRIGGHLRQAAATRVEIDELEARMRSLLAADES